MKRIYLSLIALAFVVSAGAQTLDRSVRPKPGPAPTINIGDAEQFTLPNGLKVFVVENHKLPLVTYSIQLDVMPPAEGAKAGSYGMVGQMMTAGTKSRTKDQFESEADAVAADIIANSQGMFGNSLTKHQDKLLELMSDALLNPNFKQEELDKLKKQATAGLLTQQNDAGAILRNVRGVVNYGAKHPYGEVETDATVQNIELKDISNYYNTYFKPNVAYMAVVGDITLAEAKANVEKYFSSWKKGDVARATYPPVFAPAKPYFAFAPRVGAVQSEVSITYPFPLPPGSPEIIKLRVLNEILGGSSQGRLFQNLREKHAWTYGAYSNITSDEVVGNFNASLKVKNVATDSAIYETLREMKITTLALPGEKGFRAAKNYMAGTFALGLESPNTLAQYAISIDRYKLPKNYYKDYLKKLSAITREDVQQAAKDYIRIQNANVITVGDKSVIEGLKRLAPEGEIHYYDYAGNPIQSVESKVIDGIDAQAVINKYITAIGGEKALKKIENLSYTYSFSKGGRTMIQDVTLAVPNKYSSAMKIDTRAMQDPTAQGVAEGAYEMQSIVVNGEKGTMSGQGKKTEMPASMVDKYKIKANIATVLDPKENGLSYALLQKETLNGSPAYVIERGSDGGKVKTLQYYDVKSGLLVKEIETSSEGGQPRVDISEYSDYTDVRGGNGYKIPGLIQRTGTDTRTMKLKTASANGRMSDKDFRL